MQITLEGLHGSGELWLDIMRIICGNTYGKSFLDAGCHKAPYTPSLGFTERTYVDIQGRKLDHSEEQRYFIQDDVVEYLYFSKKHFDVIIASDFLEHLTIEKGYEFIALICMNSNKQIIFTPLGEYNITDDNHPASHHSGWTPEMFVDKSPFNWLFIVLPNFHPTLEVGAFFAIRCEQDDQLRIYNEIKNKYVK